MPAVAAYWTSFSTVASLLSLPAHPDIVELPPDDGSVAHPVGMSDSCSTLPSSDGGADDDAAGFADTADEAGLPGPEVLLPHAVRATAAATTAAAQGLMITFEIVPAVTRAQTATARS